MLEVMTEMQKMQQYTNEVMQEIADAESDKEVSTWFKGLIKMIRSKSFTDSNKGISETIERLS